MIMPRKHQLSSAQPSPARLEQQQSFYSSDSDSPAASEGYLAKLLFDVERF